MTKHKKITAAMLSALAVLIVILIILWTRFGYRAQMYTNNSYAMATYVQQTVYGPEGEQAAAEAAQAVTALENQISWRVSGSDIDRLNDAAGTEWLTIDSDTVDLLALSLDVAEKSEGAFDPTVLPLTSLWRFESETPHVPTEEELSSALQYVGYADLRINEEEHTASLRRHYEGIDLGAIGKGAACDRVVSVYASHDLTAGVVSVGGSVGVYGNKPDGTDWLVALRDPDTPDESVGSIGTLQLEPGEFVSTSGTYEKQFTQDGVTYHHLLNPHTGMPEENGLVSVSVVCENGALSDALSTACFVLGKEQGLALAETYGAEVLFVDDQKEITMSDGIQERFTLSNAAYTLA